MSLRVSRFFPEMDDTVDDVPSENLKANEFLNRRHSANDCARAHLHVLDHIKPGYSVYLISAPTPFTREDCRRLKSDARSVVIKYHPRTTELYARKGWQLPTSIGRVYDGTKICRDLGFTYESDFKSILDALGNETDMPFIDDPNYINPSTIGANLIRAL